MRQALRVANEALNADEVPVGAVVSCQGQLIGKAHNQCEQLKDSSAHAEMIAMTAAAHYLGSKYLSDCTLYVTLEPCAMCAAGMGWAKLGRLVYAASDPQRGFSLWKRPLLHPRTLISHGLESTASEHLLSTFFTKIRHQRSK